MLFGKNRLNKARINSSVKHTKHSHRETHLLRLVFCPLFTVRHTFMHSTALRHTDTQTIGDAEMVRLGKTVLNTNLSAFLSPNNQFTYMDSA